MKRQNSFMMKHEAPAMAAILAQDWEELLAERKWADLGHCARSLVKVYKALGQLKEKSAEIESRLKVVEANLNEVSPKTRFAIVSHIIFCRRAIDATATQDFGGAYHRGKPE
jgi:hypothetical protein